MTIDRLLMVVFLLIAGANVSDVVADYKMEVAVWHLIVEGITVVISIIAFIVLWRRVIRRNNELAHLRTALIKHQESADAREEASYSTVKTWFNEWKLSPSEQEVAVLMIKGLTFNEIAEVRSMKEKTVRQQASAIYAKSGLSGRNNLSAWLIDALLN